MTEPRSRWRRISSQASGTPESVRGSCDSSAARKRRASSSSTRPRRARIAPTTGETPRSRASKRPAATSYGSDLQRDGLDCIRMILGRGPDGTVIGARRYLPGRRLVRALARVAVVDARGAVRANAPDVRDGQADHGTGDRDQGLDELGVVLAGDRQAVHEEAEDRGRHEGGEERAHDPAPE